MSYLKTKRVQLGDNVTASNNFVLRQPDTADGTMRISNGIVGAETDLVTVTSAGNVGVGTTSPDVFSRGDSKTLGIQGATTASLGVNAASGSIASIYVGQNGVRAGQIVGASGSMTINAGSSNYLSLGTDFTERMRIDSAGRVTMPYQPAFKISYSSATGGDTGSQQDLTFKVQDQNIGGHYNPTTGKFTAPVSGTYMFVFSLLLGNMGGGDQFEMFIKKNGSALQAAIRNVYSANSTGYGGYIAGSAVCQVPLSVNDFVTFQYYRTGSTATIYNDAQWANYSGHLIG